MSEESMQFFDCKITKSIWEQILEWIEVTHEPRTWDVELKWAIRETGKKGWKAKLLKLAFTETLYEVWLYRNDENIHLIMKTFACIFFL